MRTVVYTAISRNYDTLREVPQIVFDMSIKADVRFVCFTDDIRLKSKTWDVQSFPLSTNALSPLLMAKHPKILGHKYFCDRSIWIDASFAIRGPLWEWFDQIGNANVGLFRHTCRDCIYHEIRACREKRKDSKAKLNAASSRYRLHGHPPYWGLWMGGVIIRNHTSDVMNLNRLWWSEILSGSSRDQISLPFALLETGIKFHSFRTGAWGDCLRLRGHNSTRARRRMRDRSKQENAIA